MLLSDLLLIFLFFIVTFLVWQHHVVRRKAYENALRYTQFHKLILLDESIVLKKIRIVKSNSSFFGLERTFQFEFSSIGDERYKGEIILTGVRQKSISLQAFRTEE